VAFGHAPAHRGLSPGNLLDLSHPRLAKDRQEHDPAAARDVVADPALVSTQVEAQLTELSAKLTRIRLIEVHTPILQQVDVEDHVTKFLICQAQKPLLDRRLDLYHTPAHSNFAIAISQPRSPATAPDGAELASDTAMAVGSIEPVAEAGWSAGAEACGGLTEAGEGLAGVVREVDIQPRTHVRSVSEG
jgi:hypothetical protein